MALGKRLGKARQPRAMVELTGMKDIEFSFPGVHPQAKLTIQLMRTLRVPMDGKRYPLPPGLGQFPLAHVDDHKERLPESWITHGGLMAPMYQSEAMWIRFKSAYILERGTYPFVVKIAAGKVCALTGRPFTNELSKSPQDYVLAPGQPWIDGFFTRPGEVGQFVATPLGDGVTVEEQVTGAAEFGGLQFVVYPMKAEVFDKKFPRVPPSTFQFGSMVTVCYSRGSMVNEELGLAIGGAISQEIYKDRDGIDCWDQSVRARCYVHLLNSLMWNEATGYPPPTSPRTAADYTRANLPWFDYYDGDLEALKGTPTLGKLKPLRLEKENRRRTLKIKNIVKLLRGGTQSRKARR